MKTSDFSYELPPDRIAQVPAEPRDESRLLVVDRRLRKIEEARFLELPQFLEPDDLLVVNDTRVIPARLRGVRASGGAVEVFLLHGEGGGRWEALLRPSRRIRPGLRIGLAEHGGVEVVDRRGEGVFGIRIESATGDPQHLIETLGEMPLPPYIRRERPDARDRERYQTVFARPENAASVAAPTAGLHFTPRVLAALQARGVHWATATLHVGLGTFLPVRAADVREHRMHREWFELPRATCEAVRRALKDGRRVLAVGTTMTRVLEHCAQGGLLEPGCGWTELFLVPGHEFRVVRSLLTNFHLPQSTLLMLVCAFGGTDLILSSYRHAVEAQYRFYSYGDSMLVL